MAPNPRVGKAFRAMRDLGIPEVKVKPVLKNLLKLYEKNWELIEEENYRVLADAIFDNEETEAIEHKKKLDNADQNNLEEEAQVEDEPERPLKRSCIRDQEGPVSSSFIDSSPRLDGASFGRLKVVQAEPLESHLQQQSQDIIVSCHSKNGNRRVESLSVLPQPLLRNKGMHPVSPKHLETQERSELSQGGTTDRSQPCTMKKTEFDSISSMMHLRDKGKGLLLPEIVHRGKKSITQMPSHVACLIEPNVESDILSPNRKVSNSHSLIMPKDEPVSDDIPQFEVPTAVIHPDSPRQGNGSIREPAGSESLAPQTVDGDDMSDSIPVSAREIRTNCKLGSVMDESSGNLESLHSGEVKISLSCTKSTAESHGKVDVTPAIDFLKKTIASDTLDARGKPPIPLNGSINIQCGSAVVLPQVPRLPASSNGMDDLIQPDKNIPRNGCEIDKKQNCLEETNSHSLVIVQQHQLTPDDIRSLRDANDIAKGLERFVISLINEINREHPPSFRYIPQNIVFQNAYVNFSLAQIGDANCCSNCFGDCLSSPSPCACSHKNGGSFAYTLQGLVKEEFLEECISINRDPQQQHLFYCKECPVERSKNDDTLEQCKGHIVRKFIKECWFKCGCSKQCGNRVVQRGINCNLQVFMTSEGKGWGLRTLEDLPKGAFVCEYVGELLTKAEFFKRLPQSPGHEEQSYPVLLDADWGSEGVVKDEEALCLDATYYGNVARFINHRCFDSNLVEIPVEVETPDHHYYHLAFFTARKVEAFEELTWDYGINFDDHDYPVKAFQCQCGSLFCRNIKRSSTRSRSRAIGS